MSIDNVGEDREDEQYVYACEADDDNDAMSFYIHKYDKDYHFDSGNDVEDENMNFIHHALVFVTRVGNEIQLTVTPPT